MKIDINIIIVIIIIFILSLAAITLFQKPNIERSIYVVSMTPEEMEISLKDGSIAGFISWEPFPAKAVSEGYGKYLVHSMDIWEDHPCCVLAVSENIDEDMINGLLWVQIKSTRFINDPANRDWIENYGSEFTGINKTAVSIAINNTQYLELPDLNETKQEFEILSKTGSLKNSPTSVGYQNVDELLADLIIAEYYIEIKTKLDEDPDWVPDVVDGNLRLGVIEGDLHNLAVYVAIKEGYFEQIGLIPDRNIHFLKFRNGVTITNALSQHEVDVATFGMTPLLMYRVNDNGKVFVISGLNSGGTSLVVSADSEIRSIDDLTGSTIATPGFGSIQDVILRKMFDGFTIKTV
ncbi:MAG: ABC transporter substrate-binding protein [Methanosarcinales archaeon]|nr:ABC transporter substrate-binding protein [Methanosarcinales archaeon]